MQRSWQRLASAVAGPLGHLGPPSAAQAAIISYSTYPHIIDAIIEYAPHATLLVLRATCRALRNQVDAEMVRVIGVSLNPIKSGQNDDSTFHDPSKPSGDTRTEPLYTSANFSGTYRLIPRSNWLFDATLTDAVKTVDVLGATRTFRFTSLHVTMKRFRSLHLMRRWEPSIDLESSDLLPLLTSTTITFIGPFKPTAGSKGTGYSVLRPNSGAVQVMVRPGAKSAANGQMAGQIVYHLSPSGMPSNIAERENAVQAALLGLYHHLARLFPAYGYRSTVVAPDWWFSHHPAPPTSRDRALLAGVWMNLGNKEVEQEQWMENLEFVTAVEYRASVGETRFAREKYTSLPIVSTVGGDAQAGTSSSSCVVM